MKKNFPYASLTLGGQWLFFLFISTCFLWPAPAKASFIEQLAIDSRAISMANTVTARPPGHMSIHYNPAGLSKIPEGAWWHQGFTLPYMIKKTTFRGNPDFDGWLRTEKWDHRADPIYGQRYKEGELEGGGFEGWGDRRVEDLKATGKAKSGVMIVPLINKPIDFAISPRTSLANREEGSRWTFATGMYTPYATGANHSGSSDPSRFGSRRAAQLHLIYQAPTASYQVTDNLSVGMGVGAGQTAMFAQLDLRSPGDMTAITRELGQATKGMAIPPWTYLYYEDPLYGGGIHPWERVASLETQMRDDFTPNYNLGLLYEPFEWLGLGLVYQSEIVAHMNGYFKIEYGKDWQKMVRYYNSGPWGVRRTSMILDLPRYPTESQYGTITTTVKFPQRVQGGIRVSPLSRLHLMFDLKWAEWSIRDQDEMNMDQDIQLLQVAKLSGHKYGNRSLVSDRFMKDTVDWGIALEYNLTEKIDLHLGYEFRETSVQKKYMDLTTPIPDLDFYGVGGSYHLDNGGRLDLGLAWIRGRAKLAPEESTNLTSTDYFEDGTNMFAGQYYEGDLDIFLISFGFMVPFESYVEYQGGNREKIKKRIRMLNPFTRSASEDEGDTK